jgi:hypothetical protein
MAKQYGRKNAVLLQTSSGTHWELQEHLGNLVGTHSEPKTNSSTTPSGVKPKRPKKN